MHSKPGHLRDPYTCASKRVGRLDHGGFSRHMEVARKLAAAEAVTKKKVAPSLAVSRHDFSGSEGGR